jgi:hypothetical protein
MSWDKFWNLVGATVLVLVVLSWVVLGVAHLGRMMFG